MRSLSIWYTCLLSAIVVHVTGTWISDAGTIAQEYLAELELPLPKWNLEVTTERRWRGYIGNGPVWIGTIAYNGSYEFSSPKWTPENWTTVMAPEIQFMIGLVPRLLEIPSIPWFIADWMCSLETNMCTLEITLPSHLLVYRIGQSCDSSVTVTDKQTLYRTDVPPLTDSSVAVAVEEAILQSGVLSLTENLTAVADRWQMGILAHTDRHNTRFEAWVATSLEWLNESDPHGPGWQVTCLAWTHGCWPVALRWDNDPFTVNWYSTPNDHLRTWNVTYYPPSADVTKIRCHLWNPWWQGSAPMDYSGRPYAYSPVTTDAPWVTDPNWPTSKKLNWADDPCEPSIETEPLVGFENFLYVCTLVALFWLVARAYQWPYRELTLPEWRTGGRGWNKV